MTTRREQTRAATTAEIKNTARRLMEKHGTTGLGLRAIARELDVTAPAIYRYFPSLDELITALILDGYHALADAVEAAAAERAEAPASERLMAVLLAYREWALAHPADFQLLYGNPIPGYEAPAELTVPAADRTFRVVVKTLAEAHSAGELRLPLEYQHLPPTVDDHLRGLVEHAGYAASPAILYLTAAGWAHIHGMIMLELFNHIQPIVGDMNEFFLAEVRNLMRQFGLPPPD